MHAKNPRVDCYLETIVIGITHSGNPDDVKEAGTEIFDSQVLYKTDLALSARANEDSFQALLNRFVCINNNIGYAFGNHLLELLPIFFEQLKTFSGKF